MLERLDMPLLFDPGTSWQYGMGYDLTGALIAKLNNLTLEEYFQKYIWDPLGVNNFTFHVQLKPDVKRNRVAISERLGLNGPVQRAADTGLKMEWKQGLIFSDDLAIGEDFGGQGLYGSAVEFVEVLHSINVNDGKLMKPTTVDEVFRPQLGPGSLGALESFLRLEVGGTFGSLPPGTKVDHGLGGVLIQSDQPTGLKKGTLTWNGFPNLKWTIDRESGLSLYYASNVLPFGDYSSHRFQQLFEREMYAKYAEVQGL